MIVHMNMIIHEALCSLNGGGCGLGLSTEHGDVIFKNWENTTEHV